MKKFHLTIDAKKENLQRIIYLIENFAKEYNLDPKTKFYLQLIIEEIVVNICSYSYPKTTGTLNIEITYLKGEIKIVFIDNGIAFDPTKKIKTIKKELENAQIGGLGIHIVKQLSKEIRYKRENDQNILTIVI